ncbi:adenylate cyclase [Acrasis kona]|uniref:Adenylate cyclase n=1 Tax=Acrasis kona TaxID=1008807 RepID=A0AAW2Z6V4_9EUKA
MALTQEEVKYLHGDGATDIAIESLSNPNETDDLSTTEISAAEILYKPSKTDAIPIIVLVFFSVICLVTGLVAFFLLRENEMGVAKNDFQASVVDKGSDSLRTAIKSTGTSVSDLTALFAVTNGTVRQRSQFVPFCSASSEVKGANGTGTPPYISRVYYLENVVPENAASFPAVLLARDPTFYGTFSNLTIFSRDRNNLNYPYDGTGKSYSFITTLCAPELTQSRSLIGFEQYADPVRTDTLNKAITSGTVSATEQLSAAGNIPALQGSVLYSPVFVRNTNIILGMVSIVFQNSVLVQNTIEGSVLQNSIVSIYDNGKFMYSTEQFTGDAMAVLKNYSDAQQRQDMNLNFHRNATVSFSDRTWTLVFVPKEIYLQSYRNSFTKFIPIIVCVCVWLLAVAFSVFLFFFLRLRRSLLAREISQRKIVMLSKYLPKEFLRLVNRKNKNVRVTYMTVQMGHIEKLLAKTEEANNLMNEFYEYTKGAAKQNDGFVHRCEKNGFILLFTNEQKAYNAAVMIHRFPRGADVPIHTALHSGKVFVCMVGDNESQLPAIISDDTDALKSVADDGRKYSRKIVVSKPVLEAIKKSCEKFAVNLGYLTVNNSNQRVHAYEILDEQDEIRLKTKDTYSSAMENYSKKDYLAALTQLQTVLELDPSDASARELRDSLHFKLKVCKTTSTLWNVTDSLNESLVLGPLFEAFIANERSTENLSMWKDIVEYKRIVDPQERKSVAQKIFDKYCQKSDFINLSQSAIDAVGKRLESNTAVEPDLFNFIISDLEILMSDTHNRFKNTRLFVNGLCQIISL